MGGRPWVRAEPGCPNGSESAPGEGGCCSVFWDRQPDLLLRGRQGRPGEEGAWEGSRSGGGSKEFGGGGAHLGPPVGPAGGGQAGGRVDESRPACKRGVGNPRAQHGFMGSARGKPKVCTNCAQTTVQDSAHSSAVPLASQSRPCPSRPARGPFLTAALAAAVTAPAYVCGAGHFPAR